MKNEHRKTLIDLVPRLFNGNHRSFENLVKDMGHGALLHTIKPNLSFEDLVRDVIDAAVIREWARELVEKLATAFPQHDVLKRLIEVLDTHQTQPTSADSLDEERDRVPAGAAKPARTSGVRGLGEADPSEWPPSAGAVADDQQGFTSSIVAYDGKSPEPFSVGALLKDLGKGDSVIVAARTCLRWLEHRMV